MAKATETTRVVSEEIPESAPILLITKEIALQLYNLDENDDTVREMKAVRKNIADEIARLDALSGQMRKLFDDLVKVMHNHGKFQDITTLRAVKGSKEEKGLFASFPD